MSKPTERSFENKEEIIASDICGCYYCCRIYKSSLVKEYCKDPNGFTAICPKCGIDSVIAFSEAEDKTKESFEAYLKQAQKDSF